MFETLKRQWRIVTPLVTALVAVSIVVSAFLVPTSAHTKKVFFRYSGDAADFVSYSENPAFLIASPVILARMAAVARPLMRAWTIVPMPAFRLSV